MTSSSRDRSSNRTESGLEMPGFCIGDAVDRLSESLADVRSWSGAEPLVALLQVIQLADCLQVHGAKVVDLAAEVGDLVLAIVWRGPIARFFYRLFTMAKCRAGECPS